MFGECRPFQRKREGDSDADAGPPAAGLRVPSAKLPAQTGKAVSSLRPSDILEDTAPASAEAPNVSMVIILLS